MGIQQKLSERSKNGAMNEFSKEILYESQEKLLQEFKSGLLEQSQNELLDRFMDKSKNELLEEW